MATNKPVVLQEYSFSDGVLEQFADFIVSCLTRDLAQLASRGVTQATIDNIVGLRQAFSDLPTDGEAQGVVGVAVEEKNAARDAALVEARRLRTAAQNVFGEHTALYRSFGFTHMDSLREDSLPRQMRRMHRVGVETQAQLAAEGVTVAFLDAFLVTIGTLDNKLDAVSTAEAGRDQLTEDRHISGNTLYKELVRVCNIGKNVFATISEATYNDYVIENYVGTEAFPDTSLVVRGRVTANGGTSPIVNAAVRLGSVEEPDTEFTTTNENGDYEFRFNQLPAHLQDRARINIQAPGFALFSHDFDVEVGEIYTINAALSPGLQIAA